MKYDSVQSALKHVVKELLSERAIETNPRGMNTREIIGHSIEITDPRNRIVNRGKVKPWSLAFAIGEFLWYMRGDNSLHTMSYYAPSIAQFSDDLQTLNSAYGYRIFGHHMAIPINQWKYVKDTLNSDSASRQAIIHIRVPSDSTYKSKDHPCTLSLQFLIRNNKLNLVTTMRSNDVMIGSSYDMFSFTMIQELMAYELSVELGSYYHQVGSWHLYERDFNAAKEFIKNEAQVYAMPHLDSGIEDMIKAEEEIRLDLPISNRPASGYWNDWYEVLLANKDKCYTPCLSNKCYMMNNE